MADREEIPEIDYLFFRLSPENKKILLNWTEEFVCTQKEQAQQPAQSGFVVTNGEFVQKP